MNTAIRLLYAIILCRISDEKQEDGYSLDAQEKFGTEYCRRSGWVVDRIFRFVETASKAGERDKFQELIKYIPVLHAKYKMPIVLVVEKLDRLTRNYTSLEKIWELIRDGKLIIHFYKDNKIIDANCSPAEIFNLDIQTAVAKYQALNTAREVKKGMREKAAQGWYPGRVPLGYKNARSGDDVKHGRQQATIIVDPDARNVCLAQRIFELRATLALSYRDIAKQIRDESIVPPAKLRTFTKSTVEKILTNQFYSGRYDWQGEWFDGKHELIIAQEHLDVVYGRKKGAFSRRSRGLFSSFLTCASEACGCQVLYDPKTKTVKSTGEVKKYDYYHCSDGKLVHRNAGERQVNVTEQHLLKEFAKPVRDVSITEELATELSKALRKTHEKTVAAHRRTIDGYKAEIEGIRQQKKDLVKHLLAKTIDDKTYKMMDEEFDREESSYLSKMADTQEAIIGAFYETSEKILELAKNAETLWFSRSPQERVDFLKMILSNQVLDGTNIRYDLRKPFAVLAEMNKTEEWCPPPESRRTTNLGRNLPYSVARA